MAAALRPYRRRGVFNLDWALVVVGLMAVALLAGTVIRTDAGGQQALFGTQVGGLRALSETEHLVLFEDMTSGGGAGWSGGARNTDHLGLGAIWLADPGTPLSRDIALPQGTVRAVLSLDLIAIDDWALEGLAVSVDGTEILRHRFTTRAGLTRPTAPETRATDRIALRAGLADPREMGFAAGNPALSEERLSLEIAVTTPADALNLTITPLPAEGAPDSVAPRWAVDNLIVVAEHLP